MLLIHSAAAASSRTAGGSRLPGSPAMRLASDQSKASVVKEESAKPRSVLIRVLPARRLMDDGISSRKMRTSSVQFGPNVNVSGSAKYKRPIAITASTAGQRGSVSNFFAAELVKDAIHGKGYDEWRLAVMDATRGRGGEEDGEEACAVVCHVPADFRRLSRMAEVLLAPTS